MRRLVVFLTFLLIAATTNAQENHLTINGMRIHAGDTQLEKGEAKSLMLGTPGYDLYAKAIDQRSSGGILLGVGITTVSVGLFATMLTGLFHAMGEGDGPRGSYWRNGGATSLGAILAGSGITVGGVALMRAGKKNAARAVDAYNSSLDRPLTGGELSVGFTYGGIGLSYRF